MKLSPNNYTLNDVVKNQANNIAGQKTEYGKKGGFGAIRGSSKPANRNVVTRSVNGPLQ